jgi:chromosome segregation ATPase
MGKLHELLAVESDLKGKAQRALAQVRGVFGDGQGALIGQARTYKPSIEGGEPLAPENKELATTVNTQLDLLRADFGPWIDAAMQKETTNTNTVANVEIDGKVMFKNLPATALLNLESKLAELRGVILATPTNDASEAWSWDEQTSVYVSSERITYRTTKVPKSHELSPATKEHPAQVQLITLDERVGEWSTVISSGMLSPTQKREMVDRLEALQRAVKQARQRANSVDVIDVQIADKLFDFLLKE